MIHGLGFGCQVFIRSGCNSLVSFVVAPAGTHDITGSEHVALLEVSPANLRILPTRPPVGGQTLARHLACLYGGWDQNSDSPASVASTYD